MDNSNKGTELPIYKGAAECSACGEVFSSEYSFNKHRVGRYPNRKCRHPQDIGMEINLNGYWSRPMPKGVHDNV